MTALKKWSDVKPTGPGWWWYEDEDYGPAPVRLDRIWDLTVDMCVGEDQDALGLLVADMNGNWFPIQEPPK